MHEGMDVLVKRFLASELMKDHKVPGKLLTEIHDYLRGLNGKQPDEAQLLPNAIAGRLDPQGHAVKERTVSVQAISLRNLIETYFDRTVDGVSCSGRLKLHSEAPYLLEVVDNIPDLFDMRFWRFYVPSDKASLVTCVVATEVLFLFSPKDRCFFRYLDLNSKSRDPKDALEAAASIGSSRRARLLRKGIRTGELIPCFHYLPSGETKAANLLREWFASKGKTVEPAFSKDVDHNKVWDKHVVCLGNSRTSWCVRDYQEGLRFRHCKEGVEDRNHKSRSGTKPKFQDKPQEAFVLLTRLPNSGSKEGGLVTLVATHNTPALAAVVKELTQEPNLRRLWADMGFEETALPPSSFQVVFRVEMKNFEQTLGVEVVDHCERPAVRSGRVA